MSETRKLAAILVADVVGYSRLAGTDEERSPVSAASAATSSIPPSPPIPYQPDIFPAASAG